jgi:hypothetical protein
MLSSKAFPESGCIEVEETLIEVPLGCVALDFGGLFSSGYFSFAER